MNHVFGSPAGSIRTRDFAISKEQRHFISAAAARKSHRARIQPRAQRVPTPQMAPSKSASPKGVLSRRPRPTANDPSLEDRGVVRSQRRVVVPGLLRGSRGVLCSGPIRLALFRRTSRIGCLCWRRCRCRRGPTPGSGGASATLGVIFVQRLAHLVRARSRRARHRRWGLLGDRARCWDGLWCDTGR